MARQAARPRGAAVPDLAPQAVHRQRPHIGRPEPHRLQCSQAARREAILERAAAEEARLRRRGQHQAADDVRDRAQADAALLGKVTQHWFRHRLATLMLRRDPRATMEQGGWLDIRSVIGYSHDVPEYRRQLVAAIDDVPAAAGAKKAR